MLDLNKEHLLGTYAKTSRDAVSVELLGAKVSPQIIGRFGLDAIRSLAKRHSTAVTLLLEDAISVEEVESRLSTPEVETETPFWEAMMKAVFFVNREANVHLLTQRGLSFRDENESVTDFVVRALLEREHDVDAVLNFWLRESGEEVGGRSYTIFRSKLSPKETMSLLKGINPTRLEALLQPYFTNQGYGDHCKVKSVPSKGKNGFTLGRTGLQTNRIVQDVAKQRRTRIDRDYLTDYVFYHEGSNSLWVCAKNARDARTYADFIAMLSGNDQLFQEQTSFDLQPIAEVGFRDILARSQASVGKRPVLKRVAMKNRESNISSTESTGRRERCLSERALKSYEDPAKTISKILFGLELPGTDGEIAKIEFHGGKVRIFEGCTVEDAVALMHACRLVKFDARA
jgi:hypothetical protein